MTKQIAGSMFKSSNSNSVGLGRVPKFAFLLRSPGDADVFDLKTHLMIQGYRSLNTGQEISIYCFYI